MILAVFLWVRSLIATAFFIAVTIVAASLTLLCGIFRWRVAIDHVIRSWGRLNTWAFNIHVHVTGEENLPPCGCLFLFNHSSHFDILVFCAGIRKSARFGAKIELFRIPIFGPAMRIAGVLPIHRAEREKVFQLYADSTKKVVEKGYSFILAAEGTRQPQPGVGAKFKSGPFVFALNGQFPIVPVVIRGAAECLPKGRILACVDRWRHDVTLQVLPAVSTKGLTVEDRDTLGEQIRAQMAAVYETLPGPTNS